MIIEFLGPPGVGKTTVANALSAISGWATLANDGHHDVNGRAVGSHQIAFQRTVALATQPRMTMEILKCIRDEGRGDALSWMINLARRNAFARKHRHKDLILQEGSLSALVLAMISREKQPLDGVKMLRDLAYGDVLVILSVEPEAAIERIIGRQGILADRSVAHLAYLTKEYEVALEALHSGLPANLPIIRVATERDPSAVAATIYDQIVLLTATQEHDA